MFSKNDKENQKKLISKIIEKSNRNLKPLSYAYRDYTNQEF